MVFKVKQTFPHERTLFESNQEAEAENVLDNYILMGNGWFELWEEGFDMPVQAGGIQAFSPISPPGWDIMDMVDAIHQTLYPSTPRKDVFPAPILPGMTGMHGMAKQDTLPN